MAKRGKKGKKKEDDIDYKTRWPTQQTLVESLISKDGPEEKSSMRIRALEAASIPLLWMNMKLEQWQDGIEQRVDHIEAQRQRRCSILSLGEGHNEQSYNVATKSTSPGKSKHPYDTGVDRHTETIPEFKEEQAIPPTQAQPRELPPRERARHPILMRLSPRPKSTTESRSDNTGSAAKKSVESQGISETQGSPREPTEKSDSRKKWWWPLTKTQATSEGHKSQDNSGLEESDTTDDESDVAALVKPRSAWKSVKGRRRSTFPATKATTSKPGHKLPGGIQKQKQNNAAPEQPDNQAGAAEPKLKADAHTQPEA
ncbi:hypothetical protein F5X96DRAFT_420343 [Biscogniauxia mediterranea]|nr:hypothetical protein F5X96DRAFT_420343 [Biscogniauxia mediterranea]